MSRRVTVAEEQGAPLQRAAQERRVQLIVQENETLSAFLHGLSAQVAVKDSSNRSALAIGNHSGQEGDVVEFSRTQYHLLSVTDFKGQFVGSALPTNC